ncbi:MAG: adenylate/guanylate cyclase domain-containing protein [Turneriella sp.]
MLSKVSIHRTKDPIEDFFQKEIEKETIQSERYRLLLLVVAFTIIGVGFTLGPILFHQQFASILGPQAGRFQLWSALVFFGYAIYCIGARYVFGWYGRKDRGLPLVARYANALAETSAPTLIMILFSLFIEPKIVAMYTPAPFAYALFIVLSTLRLDPKLSLFTGFVAGVEFGAFGLYSFSQPGSENMAQVFIHPGMHLGRVMFLFFAGIAAAFVTSQIRQRQLNSFRLVQERNKVTSIFGQHVSPAVVEALLHQKEQSESRHVCVMFLDIRNFTSFSEKRSPQEVVDFLNSIFTFCIEIINKHNGIINKFLGDGFMAVFGAPLSDGRDVRNAVNAANEIIARINTEVTAGRLPDVTVGIGLHSGDAVTGNVGSTARKEYTVIGDVVNLASRIEQLNKQFGSRFLMSEDVMRFCEDLSPQFVSETQVKGREQPVKIYRLA